ncbi:hypothetical protein VNO77_44185 [Canavalia gladiata]|uniref:Uncharacterized protein n=1 Tax=Canavalia gladiata TaxID=3824 RepID=A0AAN9PQ53_CANGL
MVTQCLWLMDLGCNGPSWPKRSIQGPLPRLCEASLSELGIGTSFHLDELTSEQVKGCVKPAWSHNSILAIVACILLFNFNYSQASFLLIFSKPRSHSILESDAGLTTKAGLVREKYLESFLLPFLDPLAFYPCRGEILDGSRSVSCSIDTLREVIIGANISPMTQVLN